MIAVILAVAGSARANPDGVSIHVACWPGMICGVYPPLSTRRLCTGSSESWLIKVMWSTPAQPIQMPCGPGDAAHAGPAPGIGAAFTITSRDGSILDRYSWPPPAARNPCPHGRWQQRRGRRRAGPARGRGGRPATPPGHHSAGGRGDQGHRHRGVEPAPAGKADVQLRVLADLIHVLHLVAVAVAAANGTGYGRAS